VEFIESSFFAHVLGKCVITLLHDETSTFGPKMTKIKRWSVLKIFDLRFEENSLTENDEASPKNVKNLVSG